MEPVAGNPELLPHQEPSTGGPDAIKPPKENPSGRGSFFWPLEDEEGDEEGKGEREGKGEGERTGHNGGEANAWGRSSLIIPASESAGMSATNPVAIGFGEEFRLSRLKQMSDVARVSAIPRHEDV